MVRLARKEHGDMSMFDGDSLIERKTASENQFIHVETKAFLFVKVNAELQMAERCLRGDYVVFRTSK